MHCADIDIIISNPVVLIRVINALTESRHETNADSRKVQCIGQGTPVWTKETLKEMLDPIRVDAGLEWKEVKI